MSYQIPTYDFWPITIPDASETADGVMTAAQVQLLDLLASQLPFTVSKVYMNSATGNDANPGTLASPVKTFDRAISLVSFVGWHSKVQVIDITPGGGSFSSNSSINLGSALGAESGTSPARFSIIGQLSNIFGTLTNNNAGSTTQLQCTTPVSVRVSTTASIVAGAPAGQMRISGVPGYTAADNNKLVKVTGAASAINNETFVIINGAAAANSIDVLNAGAVTPDGNNGAITVHDSYDLDTVTITSGAQQNQTRIVRDTTISGANLILEVNEPFAGNIVTNATYTVGEPITKIDVPTGTLTFNQNVGSIGFINLSFSGNVLLFGRYTIVAVSCWFTNRLGSATAGTMTLRNGAQLIGGADTGQTDNDPFNNATQFRTGVGYKNCTVTAVNQVSLLFNAQLFRSSSVIINRATAVFQPVDARRTTFTFNAGSIVDFFGTTALPSKLKGQLSSSATTGVVNYVGAVSQTYQNVLIDGSGFGGHGIALSRSANVAMATSTVQNCAVNGINVAGRSYAELGAVAGGGNAGVGCSVQSMSQVRKGVGGATTITGVAGDLNLGAMTGLAWANSPFSEPSNNGPTLNRVDI